MSSADMDPHRRNRTTAGRMAAVILVLVASQLRLIYWVPARYEIPSEVLTAIYTPTAALVLWKLRSWSRSTPSNIPTSSYSVMMTWAVAAWVFVADYYLSIGAVTGIEALLPELTRDPPPPTDPTSSLITGLLRAPLVEELIFRVLLLGGLIRLGVGARVAVVVQALSFGAAHTDLSLLGGLVSTESAYGLNGAASTFVGGLAMGFLVVETRRIWPAVALHVLNNAIANAGMYPELDWLVMPAAGIVVAGIVHSIRYHTRWEHHVRTRTRIWFAPQPST